MRLHRTKEEIPKIGTVIDATVPIARVVDEIIRHSEAGKTPGGRQSRFHAARMRSMGLLGSRP